MKKICFYPDTLQANQLWTFKYQVRRSWARGNSSWGSFSRNWHLGVPVRTFYTSAKNKKALLLLNSSVVYHIFWEIKQKPFSVLYFFSDEYFGRISVIIFIILLIVYTQENFSQFILGEDLKWTFSITYLIFWFFSCYLRNLKQVCLYSELLESPQSICLAIIFINLAGLKSS